jgi:hypothetical protein
MEKMEHRTIFQLNSPLNDDWEAWSGEFFRATSKRSTLHTFSKTQNNVLKRWHVCQEHKTGKVRA